MAGWDASEISHRLELKWAGPPIRADQRNRRRGPGRDRYPRPAGAERERVSPLGLLRLEAKVVPKSRGAACSRDERPDTCSEPLGSRLDGSGSVAGIALNSRRSSPTLRATSGSAIALRYRTSGFAPNRAHIDVTFQDNYPDHRAGHPVAPPCLDDDQGARPLFPEAALRSTPSSGLGAGLDAELGAASNLDQVQLSPPPPTVPP